MRDREAGIGGRARGKGTVYNKGAEMRQERCRSRDRDAGIEEQGWGSRAGGATTGEHG